MSHYAEYLRERTEDRILETEEGFATYRFTQSQGGQSVYIIDLFVHPDHRKRGVASSIADRIVAIAKLRGCTKLLGTVVPSMKGSTASLRVLIGYGMWLQSAAADLVIMEKDI